MKIFKNRGDIYISKGIYKKSKEKNILIILLVIIVVITVIFIIMLSTKYPSVSSFFAEGEVTVSQTQNASEIQLPEISGKTNYIVIETDDNQTSLHFAVLIQADKDNLAYKVSSLYPKMKINSKSLYEIYKQDGAAGVTKSLKDYLGFDIDYYADFKESDFVAFINKLGKFSYPCSSDIRFDGGSGDDTYTIRIKKGETYLDGEEFSNLLRYFSSDKKDYSKSNELVLYSLTELFNEENYVDCESLFRFFNSSASTSITVRSFENSKDAVEVFCYKNTDITVYSSIAQYEGNNLSQSSIDDIKGYFSK